MQSRFLQRVGGLCLLASLLIGTSWVAYARPQQQRTAAAVSKTFAPLADAYVIQTYPSTNYGSSHSLQADASPVTRSYLRFVVSGLNGAVVQSASIKFYAGSSNSTGFSVSALADNTWTEATVTYKNAPAPGSVLAASKAFKTGTWVNVDVSSYVTGDGTYNVVVTTPSATSIKLSSREAGTKAPQLVISMLPAATATPTQAAALVPTATSTSLPTQTATVAPTATSLPTQTATSVPTQTSMPSPTPTAQTDWQPSFPIRAAFYYPWFPDSWTQLGIYPYTNYHPQLGYYSSSDSTVLQQHIDMMQYGGIQAGIAS